MKTTNKEKIKALSEGKLILSYYELEDSLEDLRQVISEAFPRGIKPEGNADYYLAAELSGDWKGSKDIPRSEVLTEVEKLSDLFEDKSLAQRIKDKEVCIQFDKKTDSVEDLNKVLIELTGKGDATGTSVYYYTYGFGLDWASSYELENFHKHKPIPLAQFHAELKQSHDKIPVDIDRIAPNTGDKRVFASGSQRDNDSKKPLPLELDPYMLMRYGYHMKMGQMNYGNGNWQLGQPDEALWDSLGRHVVQAKMCYQFPELATQLGIDKEDHLSAMIFNIMMLMHNEANQGV